MQNFIRQFLVLIAAISFAGSAVAIEPVKVFFLAGQSNMVGHGRVEPGLGGVDGAIGSLRYMVTNDFATHGHLLEGDANSAFRVRDDVWYWGLTTADGIEKGNLTVGFGAADFNIGPEFGFGQVLGDYYNEQVLIVKTAWGGRSLAVDFRPPSAVANHGGTVGPYYTEMLTTLQNVMTNIATEFPAYQGQGVELAGMGWHQGFNDRTSTFAAEYERNLAYLIQDVRNDLGVPKLPFVVAETGNGGNSETNPVALQVMEAQAAVANPVLYPEFAGNVAFAGTRDHWRDLSISPNNAYHHWHANGESYYLQGREMGLAMESLIPEPSTIALTAIGFAGIFAWRFLR